MVKVNQISFYAVLLMLLTLINCSSSDPTPETVLKSLQISPSSNIVDVGDTVTLEAIGTYSDGTTKDIVEILEWNSSNSGIATVRKGVVTAKLTGTVIISGSIGGISDTASFTVDGAPLDSISISPSFPTLANGTNQQLAATGHYLDGSTQDITTLVTWESSDVGVLTVSDILGSKGLMNSVSIGSATVTATLGDIAGTTNVAISDAVLVSIEINEADPSIANGTTQQFTVEGTFTDASTQDVTDLMTWESSDEGVATISNANGFEGLATSVGDGTTTITATYDESISAQTTLTVTTAVLLSIDVTPMNPSIANGLTQQFTATGNYDILPSQDITSVVTWSSSDVGVATISNVSGSNGLASSITDGSTTITATLGFVSGDTLLTVTAAELASIVITPENPSIRNGTLQQFSATGIYTDSSTVDVTTSVVWDSSDMGVATISNVGGSEGLATSVTDGSTTITATLGLISGNTMLTVLDIHLISIAVTPANPSIALGTTERFIATGTFDDASTQDLTDQVTWDSSDVGVATISNADGSEGLATSVVDGPTTITATLGLISGNTLLTVTPATIVSVEVTPLAPSIVDGNEQQFVAMGTFSDASVQDITADAVWDSSDVGVATISNADGSEGLATSVTDGVTTITATFDFVSDNTTLTVTPAELVSIDVTPTTQTIGIGVTLQFTATGTYTDETTQDITTSVTWSSSNTAKATISNAGGSEGLATAVANGSTTITATLGLISDNTLLTVAKILDYVEITPTTPTLKKNKNRQLKGRAYYSDGTNSNKTADITRWTSSNEAVIKMNYGGTAGKVRALTNSGTSTITFTYTENGITRSDTLDITAIP
jgi:hypothetical protein